MAAKFPHLGPEAHAGVGEQNQRYVLSQQTSPVGSRCCPELEFSPSLARHRCSTAAAPLASVAATVEQQRPRSSSGGVDSITEIRGKHSTPCS